MSVPLPGRTLVPGPGTFHAFRHRDFRLLWGGLVVSLTGRWAQSVAQGWLVLRLTDSPFWLGIVGFFTFLPVLLFSLPAGVAADRLPRRLTLFWTQGTAMVMALALALLTWLDAVSPWHVALIAFGTGCAGALDIPVRQSFLQDLVGREDLPNAIALNSLAFNGARLVGPALGGALLAARGEAAVFLFNGLTYLAVLASLMGMDARDPRADGLRTSWRGEIRLGLRHAIREPRTRVILALVIVSGIFASPYQILLPACARDVLGVDERGLGWMMGAAGLGAVGGALMLARRGRLLRPGRTIAVALAVLGAALVGFSVARSYPAALALLVVVGGAMIVQMATSNTALQLLSPPELRGRIISLYMLAFLGTSPFGALLAGWVAGRLGPQAAIGLGGGACVVAAVWFATRIPALREASRPAEDVEDPAVSAG